MRRLPAMIVAALWLALPAGAEARSDDDDWILPAMEAELDRSRQALRLEGYDAPYFVAATVRDARRSYVSGKSGALFQSADTRNRLVSVDVRVGDYAMDSSEDPDEFYNQNQKYQPNNLAPLDASPAALRRAIWLLADFRYKAALMSFLTVKAKAVNDPKERLAGSMSREPAFVHVEPSRPWKFDRAPWESVVRKTSAVFLDYPEVFDASVEVGAVRLTRYMVNSEGTRVRTVDDYYQLFVTAVARADDGMLVQDVLTYYGRAPSDLPALDRVLKDTRDLADRMRRLRAAEVLDPQTVPVLMSPQATGVFFHETVGHRLEGFRQNNEEEGRTFKGQIGQRILPEFIDVYDDPETTHWDGISLNGAYRVDDEAVRGRRAELVEAGILRGFLMGRRPVEGVAQSNGHGRSDGFQRPVGRMANLVVRGRSPVPDASMKAMLLDEVRRQGKPFGLIVETIAGGATNTSSYGFQAYKGQPRIAWRVDAQTGAETLVRGFEIVGTPLSSINRIVATGDRYDVFNGYCGAESGMVPVSAVAPAMLFAEMETQRAQQETERPLILPPPAVGAIGGAR
jgi:predicted Zn-dependent protease